MAWSIDPGHFNFEHSSLFTSNLRLKFWQWIFGTTNHQFFSKASKSAEYGLGRVDRFRRILVIGWKIDDLRSRESTVKILAQNSKYKCLKSSFEMAWRIDPGHFTYGFPSTFTSNWRPKFWQWIFGTTNHRFSTQPPKPNESNPPSQSYDTIFYSCITKLARKPF
jgi:hypothetical protein